jgi:hypothetical protein
MSDCLHCDINQLVQERFERGDTDLAEMASMMVESLADLVLLAPESDRSNLMAHALSAFGQIVLEKSGALEGVLSQLRIKLERRERSSLGIQATSRSNCSASDSC